MVDFLYAVKFIMIWMKIIVIYKTSFAYDYYFYILILNKWKLKNY
jgi:hypothetical protein